LGNAFLAQQSDVMNAVQRMRSRASANGRLASTAQQTVTEDQAAIEIQPANPQIIYVPTYNPAYVWGPPAWGAYPSLGYGYGSGFSFNPGVLIGAIFSGLMSFGGWGWGLNWLAHALFLNNLFFGHFGFGGGGGFGARSVWAHNPTHRMGVAYPNHMVASHFSGAPRVQSARGWERGGEGGGARAYQSANRGVEANRYNSPARSYQSANRSVEASRYNSPRSYESYNRTANASRSYRAPASNSHYSAPKMPHNSASHMKAPKMSSPKGHSSGHSSGGHSSKHK
jgi:hypothetical protein